MDSLTAKDVNQLATFNGEVARGILHSAEWKQKMWKLQQSFNSEQTAERNKYATPFAPHWRDVNATTDRK